MKKILSLICILLMVLTTFTSGVGLANDNSENLVFSAEGLKAIEKSVYVNTQSRTAHIDEEKALDYYEFTAEELQYIQDTLDNLTDDQIQIMIDYSQVNSKGGSQIQVAPIIIWGGIALIGIFTGAALYFSSKYMTHQEKMSLINQCYAVGGTPSIESGDEGGLYGAPKKAWWKLSNTYDFECIK